MNEDREQAFDDFLETRAWDAAQQALFDALRTTSHHPLPPLCKGRWRTNVSRRGCRSGAGEGYL